MERHKLVPFKNIGDLTFYKYPYLDVGIAVSPADAIYDLLNIWTIRITDANSSCDTLAYLVSQGRKTGTTVKLYI